MASVGGRPATGKGGPGFSPPGRGGVPGGPGFGPPGRRGPLLIRPGLSIPQGELTLTAALAGGPGGQHVNKTSTKVVLRFDLAGSTALTAEQKERLRGRVPPRYLAQDGAVVLVTCDEHRSQLRNREACLERLAAILREGLQRPRKRIATRPGKAARARRRESKQRQTKKKEGRRSSWGE